ncbi:hypothetical protein AAHA92_02641 [Salvia divinorum]|uniref:Uncharacterized protein n=1 Tax=Salvia divinorum TaxID=28513 RepID=A0ABD1IFE1_SALDI
MAPSRISLVAVQEEERCSRCRPAPTSGARLPGLTSVVLVAELPSRIGSPVVRVKILGSRLEQIWESKNRHLQIFL